MRRGDAVFGCSQTRSILHYFVCELLEEIVGHLLVRGVDNSRAQLREFTLECSIDRAGQHSPVPSLMQCYLGAAVHETGWSSLAFAGNVILVGLIYLGERELAIEGRLDRAEFRRHSSRHTKFVDPLQAVAASKAMLQDLRVVEGGPDRVTRRLDAILILSSPWFFTPLIHDLKALDRGSSTNSIPAAGRPEERQEFVFLNPMVKRFQRYKILKPLDCLLEYHARHEPIPVKIFRAYLVIQHRELLM